MYQRRNSYNSWGKRRRLNAFGHQASNPVNLTPYPFFPDEYPVGGGGGGRRGGTFSAGLPTASFSFATADPLTRCDDGSEPYRVCFTSNSTNPNTSIALTHNWMFNDGNASVSNETNPCHTFPGPGTYPVTLIVRAQDTTQGQGQITQFVTLLPCPAKSRPDCQPIAVTANQHGIPSIENTLAPADVEDGTFTYARMVGSYTAGDAGSIEVEGSYTWSTPDNDAEIVTVAEQGAKVVDVRPIDNERPTTVRLTLAVTNQENVTTETTETFSFGTDGTVQKTPDLLQRTTGSRKWTIVNTVDNATTQAKTYEYTLLKKLGTTGTSSRHDPILLDDGGSNGEIELTGTLIPYVRSAANENSSFILGYTGDASDLVQTTLQVNGKLGQEWNFDVCGTLSLVVGGPGKPGGDAGFGLTVDGTAVPSENGPEDGFDLVAVTPEIERECAEGAVFTWILWDGRQITGQIATDVVIPEPPEGVKDEVLLYARCPSTGEQTYETITVNRPPDPPFDVSGTVDVNDGDGNPETFDLTGTVLSDPGCTAVSWEWVLPDGTVVATTRDANNVTIPPDTGGLDDTITVRATCTDNGRTTETTLPVPRLPPMNVEGTVTPVPEEEGLDLFDLTAITGNAATSCPEGGITYTWVLPDGTTAASTKDATGVYIPRRSDGETDTITVQAYCPGTGETSTDTIPITRPTATAPTLSIGETVFNDGECTVTVNASQTGAREPVQWSATVTESGYTTTPGTTPPFIIPVQELPSPGTVEITVTDGVTGLSSTEQVTTLGYTQPQTGWTYEYNEDGGGSNRSLTLTSTHTPALILGSPVGPTTVTYQLSGPNGESTTLDGGDGSTPTTWDIPSETAGGDWTIRQTVSGPCNLNEEDNSGTTVTIGEPVQALNEPTLSVAYTPPTEAIGTVVYHSVTFQPSFNNDLTNIDEVRWEWSPTDPAGDHTLVLPGGFLNGLEDEHQFETNDTAIWKLDGTDIVLPQTRCDVVQGPYTLTLTLTNGAGSVSTSTVFAPSDGPPFLTGNRVINWATNKVILDSGFDPNDTIQWITSNARYTDLLQGNTVSNFFRWDDASSNPNTIAPTAPYENSTQTRSWDLDARGSKFPLGLRITGPRGVDGVHTADHWTVDRSLNYVSTLFDVNYDQAPAVPPRSNDLQIPFGGNQAEFTVSNLAQSSIDNFFPLEYTNDNTTVGFAVRYDAAYFTSSVFRDGYLFQREVYWKDTANNPFTITGDPRWDLGGIIRGGDDQSRNMRTSDDTRYQIRGTSTGLTGTTHALEMWFYNENTYEYEVTEVDVTF